jgi:hypothetical protein
VRLDRAIGTEEPCGFVKELNLILRVEGAIGRRMA